MKFQPEGDKDSNYSLPPEGEYLLEITETQERTGKKPPHNGYINVTLRIVDGDYKDAFIWDIWMMQGKGAWMGGKKATQFGIDLTAGSEINISEWVGRRAYGYVKHETYQGKTNAKIDANMFEAGYRPDPSRDEIPF